MQGGHGVLSPARLDKEQMASLSQRDPEKGVSPSRPWAGGLDHQKDGCLLPMTVRYLSTLCPQVPWEVPALCTGRLAALSTFCPGHSPPCPPLNHQLRSWGVEPFRTTPMLSLSPLPLPPSLPTPCMLSVPLSFVSPPHSEPGPTVAPITLRCTYVTPWGS